MSRDVGRKSRENCFTDAKKRVFGTGGETKHFIIHITIYNPEG